jgi:transglutaminase-like putative cysteine protease
MSYRCCFAFALATVWMQAEGIPRVREVSFHYEVKVAPTAAERVELWLPVPQTDAFQTIGALAIASPFPYRIDTAPDGNRELHLMTSGASQPFTVAINFTARRTERLQHDMAPQRLQPEDLAPYLRPDRLAPIDGKIRDWAREVVEKAGAHTDIEQARAIYDHIVATVKYEKTGKGWGRGDIYYACDARRGNCTDFHAIFIGYCRARGIPARFSIGFSLPEERGAGRIAGYHCWAEFYAKGIGWIPVDASEAAKDPAKREYFFGAHDENRVQFTRGRDLMLTPRQGSGALNYFIYPYAEADGKPMETLETRYEFKDIR